jgi:hypothetical protein
MANLPPNMPVPIKQKPGGNATINFSISNNDTVNSANLQIININDFEVKINIAIGSSTPTILRFASQIFSLGPGAKANIDVTIVNNSSNPNFICLYVLNLSSINDNVTIP